MENGIALVQSKTFWGAALSVVAAVAGLAGLPGVAHTASDQATLTGILDFVSAAGGVIAIGGRFVAAAKIVSILPAKT